MEKRICIGCERKDKYYYAHGLCRSCYKRWRNHILPNHGFDVMAALINNMFQDYWKGRNSDGTFVKGNQIGIDTRIQKGQNLSPQTQFKRGEKHPNFVTGTSRSHHTYRKDLNVKKGQVVHHKDGNHLNNDPDNIILFNSHSEHMKYHWKIQKEKDIKGRFKKSDEVLK